MKQMAHNIGTFNQDKLVQLFVDCPNEQESNGRAKLFGIGSCGLHTLVQYIIHFNLEFCQQI